MRIARSLTTPHSIHRGVCVPGGGDVCLGGAYMPQGGVDG